MTVNSFCGLSVEAVLRPTYKIVRGTKKYHKPFRVSITNKGMCICKGICVLCYNFGDVVTAQL